MAEKEKKPFYKKKWVWVLAVLVVIIAAAASSSKGNQARETTKSTDGGTSQAKTETKARLTLDDGWQLDTSNPYATKVVGYVSNNSDEAIKGYIQITFSALDTAGANVGDCLANANTVDGNGKWKFEALCSGSGITTVRFKEITGF